MPVKVVNAYQVLEGTEIGAIYLDKNNTVRGPFQATFRLEGLARDQFSFDIYYTVTNGTVSIQTAQIPIGANVVRLNENLKLLLAKFLEEGLFKNQSRIGTNSYNGKLPSVDTSEYKKIVTVMSVKATGKGYVAIWKGYFHEYEAVFSGNVNVDGDLIDFFNTNSQVSSFQVIDPLKPVSPSNLEPLG